MTERKGEPNRSVQRSNFPSTSTAKACGMPKTLKDALDRFSAISNPNVSKTDGSFA